jgi:peroxiredoxin
MVSYDPVAKIASFAEARQIGYPILSDPKSEIIRAFDLLNETYAPGNFAHGVAHPIIFVVDPSGVVRHRFAEENYQQRPAVDLVLEAIRKDAGRAR